MTKLECFAVKRGQVKHSRNDPHFYMPQFRALIEKLNFVGSEPLHSIVAFSDETWDGTEDLFGSTFPYIEISAVGLGINEYKVIETAVADAPSRARQLVRGHDILVSLTRPHRGAVAKVRPEDDGAVASTGFAVIRHVKPRVLSDYPLLYLISRLGSEQMLMRSSGGSYPAITKEELANVLIPRISIDFQRHLLQEMESALSQRKTKMEEAEALLVGLDDFVLDSLDIQLSTQDVRHAFAIRRRTLNGREFSPSAYTPEVQNLLSVLSGHSATSSELGAYVDINPKANVLDIEDDQLVGFIPMGAVSDGATGEYVLEERPLSEVRKGYTPFKNGDILWARITPCMQNGKSCIVDDLPNGIGFGSTEFHILRVQATGVLPEFVREFVSQQAIRDAATYVFTGSAGQQRVPATFLRSLPFPLVPEAEQRDVVEAIGATRAHARRLQAEAEEGWQTAKQWFEEQLLGPAAV